MKMMHKLAEKIDAQRNKVRLILSRAVNECEAAGISLSVIRHEMLSVAEELPGEASVQVPKGGLSKSASAGQPNGEGVGPFRPADKANVAVLAASPHIASRAGHSKNAADGRVQHAGPVREPSAMDREAAAVVKREAATTILDTLKVDGRPIGDWTIGEAAVAASEKLRNGHVLLAAARHYANADPKARIRDVIKVADLERIVQAAAEKADAA